MPLNQAGELQRLCIFHSVSVFGHTFYGNYVWGKRRNVTNPGICNCLQGAGDFRDQTGEAYWSYVSQADREKLWCPVSSYFLRMYQEWLS